MKLLFLLALGLSIVACDGDSDSDSDSKAVTLEELSGVWSVSAINTGESESESDTETETSSRSLAKDGTSLIQFVQITEEGDIQLFRNSGQCLSLISLAADEEGVFTLDLEDEEGLTADVNLEDGVLSITAGDFSLSLALLEGDALQESGFADEGIDNDCDGIKVDDITGVWEVDQFNVNPFITIPFEPGVSEKVELEPKRKYVTIDNKDSISSIRIYNVSVFSSESAEEPESCLQLGNQLSVEEELEGQLTATIIPFAIRKEDPKGLPIELSFGQDSLSFSVNDGVEFLKITESELTVEDIDALNCNFDLLK